MAAEDDVLKLIISTDSKDLEEVNATIQQFNAQGYELVRVVDNATKAGEKHGVVLKFMRDGVEALDVAFKEVGESSKLVTDSIKRSTDVKKIDTEATKTNVAIIKQYQETMDSLLKKHVELRTVQAQVAADKTNLQSAIRADQAARQEASSLKQLQNSLIQAAAATDTFDSAQMKAAQAAERVSTRLPSLAARGAANLGSGMLGRSQVAAGLTEGLGVGVAGGVGIGLAVAGASALKDAFVQGMQDAPAYYATLTRLSTFANTAGMSVSALASNVNLLTQSFGVSREEVTQGLFTVIQDSAFKGADAVKLLSESLKLSATTGASSADTTKVLSDVTRVYGMNLQQASNASALLFKASTDTGLSMSELAQFMARTGLNSKALGMSFEDVLAALTVMRKEGLSSSDSFQLLTQTETGLLKPTKELSEAYRQLGVQDGPQFVTAMGGILPALAKLNELSHGNVEQFGLFIPRVRNARGALFDLSEAAKATADATNGLSGATEAYNKSAEKMAETTDRTVKRMHATWSNFFVDAGNKLEKWLIQAGQMENPAAQKNLDTLPERRGKQNSQEIEAERERAKEQQDRNKDFIASLAARNAVINKAVEDHRAQLDERAIDDKAALEAEVQNAATAARQVLQDKRQALHDRQADEKDALRERIRLETDARKEGERAALDAMKSGIEKRKELYRQEQEKRAEQIKVDARINEQLKSKYESDKTLLTFNRATDPNRRPQTPAEAFTEDKQLRESAAAALRRQAESAMAAGDAQGAHGAVQQLVGLTDEELAQRQGKLGKLKKGSREYEEERQAILDLFNQKVSLHQKEVDIEKAIDDKARADKQAERAAELADREKLHKAEEANRKIEQQAAEAARMRERDERNADRKAERDEQKKERDEAAAENIKVNQLKKEVAALVGLKPEKFKTEEQANDEFELRAASIRGRVKDLSPASAERVSDALNARKTSFTAQVGIEEQEKRRKDLMEEATKIQIGAIGMTERQKNAEHDLVVELNAVNEALLKKNELLGGFSLNRDKLPTVPGHASGGFIRGYASGGLAASDTVPAMLTPGEYVMPRNRVAQFFPMLENIRLNGTTNNYSNGSSNSLSMGNINVSVGGGETPSQTALEIGRALRREIRRGTLNLSGG